MQVSKTYTLSDCYRMFKQDCRDRGEIFGHIVERDYRKIFKRYTELLVEDLLAGLECPIKYLGRFKVMKRQTDVNNLKVDFHNTKRLGKTVYHLNTESEGYFPLVLWDRPWRLTKKSLLFNSGLYEIKFYLLITKKVFNIMRQHKGHTRFEEKKGRK